VNDAAPGGHPLNVACGDSAAVADAVSVLDRAGQNVGNRFNPPVRMPRKAGQVILGMFVPEIVEEQERIEIGGISESERAPQVDAGSFCGGLGLNQPLYRPRDIGVSSG